MTVVCIQPIQMASTQVHFIQPIHLIVIITITLYTIANYVLLQLKEVRSHVHAETAQIFSFQLFPYCLLDFQVNTTDSFHSPINPTTHKYPLTKKLPHNHDKHGQGKIWDLSKLLCCNSVSILHGIGDKTSLFFTGQQDKLLDLNGFNLHLLFFPTVFRSCPLKPS